MKKLLLSFVIAGIFSASLFGTTSISCKSCISGHSESSSSCHTKASNTKIMDCHTQSSGSDSCDMNDSGEPDCQLCNVNNYNPSKKESVTSIILKKQTIDHLNLQEYDFSNQIPPPSLIVIQPISEPSVTSSHLTFLSSIRLII
ncbi:hypothetical protein HOG98_01350 [bacterium]|nr:hypothetical protein [bacterium]